MRKSLNKSQKGFTLIELLVVIGIIAILAVIVLIAINPARQFEQARNTQRTSNVNAILNAIGQFIADNKGELPDGIGGEIDGTLCAELVDTYLPALPTDPNSDRDGEAVEEGDCAGLGADDVEYTTENNGGRITVSAEGEDPDSNGTIDIEVTR